jgi:3-oxoacyl-[acyl-carrier-protein] synthase-3
VLLEPAQGAYGVEDTYQRVDGSEWYNLQQPGGGSRMPASVESVEAREHFLKQNGRPVFKQAVRRMAQASAHVLERNGLTPDDLRYLVPHQANRRIIEAAAHHMDLPMEKVMLNIERYGNTTAGTLPLCLHDWEEELRPGDRLLLTTFGGGYTWGASLVSWAYDGAKVADRG